MDRWIGSIHAYPMAKFTYGTRTTFYLNISTLLQMAKNKGTNHPLATDTILFGGMNSNLGGVASKLTTIWSLRYNLICGYEFKSFYKSFGYSSTHGTRRFNSIAKNGCKFEKISLNWIRFWKFMSFRILRKQATAAVLIVKPHFSYSPHYYIPPRRKASRRNTQPILHIKVGVQSGKVYSQGMFGQFSVAKRSCSFMDRSEDSMHAHNLMCLMMEGICWNQGGTQQSKILLDQRNSANSILNLTCWKFLSPTESPSQ